jgi:hypothetical protein
MSNQADGAKSANSGQINSVSTAGGECHPAATGEKSTATRLANSKPIVPDKWHVVNPMLRKPMGNATRTVTLACEFCGDSFVAKRPWARFCGGTCRVAAFRARQLA